MDHGIAEVAAAGLLAMIGVFDLVGTLASGWLTDRYDPRKLLAWYYGLRGLSLLALPFVIESQGAGLVAFVVFFGLDWVATVPPTVALTADTFGRRASGSSSAGSSPPTSSARAPPRSGPAPSEPCSAPTCLRSSPRPALARRGVPLRIARPPTGALAPA